MAGAVMEWGAEIVGLLFVLFVSLVDKAGEMVHQVGIWIQSDDAKWFAIGAVSGGVVVGVALVAYAIRSMDDDMEGY